MSPDVLTNTNNEKISLRMRWNMGHTYYVRTYLSTVFREQTNKETN